MSEYNDLENTIDLFCKYAEKEKEDEEDGDLKLWKADPKWLRNKDYKPNNKDNKTIKRFLEEDKAKQKPTKK